MGADLHVFQDRGPIYYLAEPHSLEPGEQIDAASLRKQPSLLLNARYRVVDFGGRDSELGDLEAWRDDVGRRIAARWLHGPGGQGKTRLAAEFAADSGAAGWKIVTVIHGRGAIAPQPQSVDLRLDEARGVLLVVDYADRWPLSHLAWLFNNALLHHAVPTRLLMVARSAQSWIPARSVLRERRVATDQYLLRPLADGDELGVRVQMFNMARDRFAAAYGIVDPTAVTSPVSLRGSDFGLILALHMAALVAVDAHANGEQAQLPHDMAGLSAYLLDRERRHWALLYENGQKEQLDFKTPSEVMARAVFTAALTGSMPFSQGKAILHQLDLEIHPDRILSDHGACYPCPDAESVLEPLYPDRLAEDFLALTLPNHHVPEHPGAVWATDVVEILTGQAFHGTVPVHIARAITFLAAAAGPGRWDHVAAHLNRLLGASPAMAMEAGSAALTLLADVPGIDTTVLEAIESLFPEGKNADLDLGIAAVVDRLARRRLAMTQDPLTHARVRDALAQRLHNAGLHSEAIVAATSAWPAWRCLARTNPDLESVFAISLCNLSIYLLAVNRRRDALMIATRSVEILRRWKPEMLRRESARGLLVHAPTFAAALTVLSACLLRMGQPSEALISATEAVVIRRRLAAGDPTAHEPSLAESLMSVSGILNEAGRCQEAVLPAEEAVGILRRLADDAPNAHEPALAVALSNLGFFRCRAKRWQEALVPAEEAVKRLRRLTDINAAAFEPDLARSLSCLGLALSEAERWPEAVDAQVEALIIRRRLVAADADVYAHDLAGNLTKLSVGLADLDRWEEALHHSLEAVAIRRRLAAANPSAYEFDLGIALIGLAYLLGTSRSGMPLALEALDEAIEINERAAESNPLAAGVNLNSGRILRTHLVEKIKEINSDGDAV
ncbi:tetratricopeptide repeat protein [Streptomyces sp. NPDC050508]|uniref:tetratricopeptide repeat protein n=1 Tax=Streptomyces sp. NPDC050508 TaxID=3155405 RepID=UPI003433FCBC